MVTIQRDLDFGAGFGKDTILASGVWSPPRGWNGADMVLMRGDFGRADLPWYFALRHSERSRPAPQRQEQTSREGN